MYLYSTDKVYDVLKSNSGEYFAVKEIAKMSDYSETRTRRALKNLYNRGLIKSRYKQVTTRKPEVIIYGFD